MTSLADLKNDRLRKLNQLKELGIDPFVQKTNRTHQNKQITDNFSDFEEKPVCVTGRVTNTRIMGGIAFIDIVDSSGKIQLYIKKQELEENNYSENELSFKNLKLLDSGDFIESSGIVTKTTTGEVSILSKNIRILTKSLLPLPSIFKDFDDIEERYRKRYLDLFLNAEIRELFEKKAKFWETTRQFMQEKGFMEVETPTLENTTGGAEATPFITHHNDFDIDVYLRISVGELWQKRLMAGGFEKIFEIGRAYRNEGSSPNHLQEFTNMEFYWAYADYNDGMKLTEELYRTVAKEVFGTTQFKVGEYEFDLAGNWKKIDYRDEVLKTTGIDILTATEEQIKEKLAELGVKYEGGSIERLTDSLWKYCRKKIAGPVFLINHPKRVSPLAKAVKENPELTQRFQIILAGTEIGNGYSELNDPIDQRLRFGKQQKILDAGDDEAMMPDWEFVEMLEHGMPPTCGFGFGERLFSVLCNKTIRETTLFPLMKPENTLKEQKAGQTNLAVAVVNKGMDLEEWQVLNTVAHLSASFAGREKKDLYFADEAKTRDGHEFKMNMTHAIMIKYTNSNSKLVDLLKNAQEEKLSVVPFTKEMIETSDDQKVINITKEKNLKDLEILGVLVYGKKFKVDELTNQFKLWGA